MTAARPRVINQLGIPCIGSLNQFSVEIVGWIGIKQTFLVSQNYQQVGFDQVGYQRTQRIVITETWRHCHSH
jgi:hypothetical protein